MITSTLVREYLRLPAGESSELVDEAVAATVAFIERVRSGTAAAEWSAAEDQAGLMLAARLIRRRATPSGIEAGPDGAVYVPRRDSDVDMLLRLGPYARPRVGGRA